MVIKWWYSVIDVVIVSAEISKLLYPWLFVEQWTSSYNTDIKFKIFFNGAATMLNIRRIYIANFAIFKIATFWSYHLHLRENSRSFVETETSRVFKWLVVRMCDDRLQCMHSCMHPMQYAWGLRGYLYTFQRARIASCPEVPKVTWWKVATFLRLPFTLANFAWNFAKFQKNRTPAWYFSGEVSSIVSVVARQLAPKCRD